MSVKEAVRHSGLNVILNLNKEILKTVDSLGNLVQIQEHMAGWDIRDVIDYKADLMTVVDICDEIKETVNRLKDVK